jgi:2-polyprenyl-6-methoxyphenol hydroxylase-like FAD-dependent oxidoreductase
VRPPIEIVGGGLAGLTLGILLRQRGVPVQIWEAGNYPRHRVCGEFISGRGIDVLDRIGLLKTINNSGARPAKTVAFYRGRFSSPVQDLPRPALCISRFKLDALLVEQFLAAGGILERQVRKANFGEGVVRATGRRIHAQVNGWRWFGLKAHAQNIALEADLEMHLTENGYIGLCKLDDGWVNICGLFRSRQTVTDLAKEWKRWFQGEARSALAERMSAAIFDPASFCSVAGISLRRESITQLPECSIGDAITMIPPVTGNGMSLAFESAFLAAEPLAQYHAGERNWITAQEGIAHACNTTFQRRLYWAALVQGALMNRHLAGGILRVCSVFPGAWSFLFQKTRC